MLESFKNNMKNSLKIFKKNLKLYNKNQNNSIDNL